MLGKSDALLNHRFHVTDDGINGRSQHKSLDTGLPRRHAMTDDFASRHVLRKGRYVAVIMELYKQAALMKLKINLTQLGQQNVWDGLALNQIQKLSNSRVKGYDGLLEYTKFINKRHEKLLSLKLALL